MLAAGCILGGDLRVGLEDSIYLADGSAVSGNGDLVERAVALVRTVGGEPANIEEAKRSLIGLESGRV
jgi:3-keto-5-aminohexanoate cleavage enzyme